MLNTDTDMLTIFSETNPEVCRKLWEECIPSEQLTDLWDVRACFHQHFQRDLFFVVAKEADLIVGLLPLSFVKEQNYYGYFPGETWKGKTWLEQNRIIARDQDVLRQMLRWLDDNGIRYHLRYLCADPMLPTDLFSEDEIGFFFYPKTYNFLMDDYYAQFSNKRLKTLRREINKMYDQNLVIQGNEVDHFNEMVALNIERFGGESYFASNTFTKSFRALRDYLEQKNLLRMTTVTINNTIAAVDMGVIYNGDYKMLAGGTHFDFPGIAKLINLHHMETACRNNYNSVDFLCGDFSWKRLFHLNPQPLYKVSNITE